VNLVIVLCHLMNKDGVLNEESKLRANLAKKIFFEKKCDFLLTLGHDYRKDSNLPISHSFKNYLVKENLPSNKIFTDINSRDTVGDAIFSRLFIEEKKFFKKIYIVSSDYHIKRVQIIFKKIISNKYSLEFFSSKSKTKIQKIKEEKSSTKAFFQTFKKEDFKSLNTLLLKLASQHPYYNGEIYKSIDIRSLQKIK
tara:strand:- start:23018 stop:23605 length:588 start_codon:yes stop_codon:yes gene_type:complete